MSVYKSGRSYTLDIETTTNIEAANKSRKELLFEDEITFACSVAYAPIAESVPHVFEYYGKQKAAHAILNLPSGIYYTWNGARFDMHFIYHILRKAGYTKQEETPNNESKNQQLKKSEFNYLLAGSKFISLNFRSRDGLVEIKDACLLFSCSLKKFIENTCPELPKLVGRFDYSKYREFESDFTEEEKSYCRSDVKGFAIGLHRIQKAFLAEFQGLDILESFTAGSFAMKYAKRELGSDKVAEFFPKTDFDRGFVMGGRTYVNPLHAGKVIQGDITKIDANSFYPAAMVDTKLPYGRGKRIAMTSRQLRDFLQLNPDAYVFAHLIKGVCHYKGKFSPITTRDGFNREYPRTAGSTDGVYLDDNILRDENFVHEGSFMCYIFKGTIGLLSYMRKIYELKNWYKQEGQFALELSVKIILNATFGKFLQREIIEEHDFFDGIIQNSKNEKVIRGWYLYAPLGAAITANCRHILCKFMNILGDHFIYCDTDSLIFTGETPKEIPLGAKLGEWKVEAAPEMEKKKTGKGVFFQRKTYALEVNGKTEITFCGISNDAIKRKYPDGVTVEKLANDMKKGIQFEVLQGNQTKNGVVLVERAKLKKYSEKL